MEKVIVSRPAGIEERMTHSFRFLAAAVLAFSLLCCGRLGAVAGSGKVVTVAREVGAFKKLEVGDNVDVTFVKGAPAVSVTTDDNLVSLVGTTVRDGVLVIEVKSPVVDATGGIQVTVTNDVLDGISVSGASGFKGPAATPANDFRIDASGASHVELSGLVASKVIVNVSGASDVGLVQGSSTSLTVVATGASTFASHGFTSDDVNVEVSGGSSVCVTANKSITGNASGGSTVTVSGGPGVLDVHSSGGSHLIKEG